MFRSGGAVQCASLSLCHFCLSLILALHQRRVRVCCRQEEAQEEHRLGETVAGRERAERVECNQGGGWCEGTCCFQIIENEIKFSMEAHTEGRAPTSKLRRGRGAEGLRRRGERCRGRKADVPGRRVESTEWWVAHRRSAHGEGKHATGAQGGHNTFLISEKVLRVFQDF